MASPGNETPGMVRIRHLVIEGGVVTRCVVEVDGRTAAWEDTARTQLDCANCGFDIGAHCTQHLVPCCPGKCPLDQPAYSATKLQAVVDAAEYDQAAAVEFEGDGRWC